MWFPSQGGNSRTRDNPHDINHQKHPNFPKKHCQRKQRRKTVILLWESQASSKLKLRVHWKVVGDSQYRIRRLLIVLPQTGLQPSLNCGILFCELSPVALWLLPISHLRYYQRIYVMLWPHPLDDLTCPKGTHVLTHDFLMLAFDLLVSWVIFRGISTSPLELCSSDSDEPQKKPTVLINCSDCWTVAAHLYLANFSSTS